MLRPRGALLRSGEDRARGTEKVTATPQKYMAFVKMAERK